MTLPLSEYPGTFLKILKGELSNSGFSNFSLLTVVSFRVDYSFTLDLFYTRFFLFGQQTVDQKVQISLHVNADAI